MIEPAGAPADAADRDHTASKLRLGFAGVGWIGRSRLEAIVSDGIADVAAIADPALTTTDALPACCSGATLAGSFAELLSLKLDGIVIATPSALHASQAIAALGRGIPVFCQKPLGRNLAETAAVIDAARAADRLLGVDLSYRYTTGMQEIRRHVALGTLGPVTAIEATFHNAYGPDKPWFYCKSDAGGGCLLDLGIHMIDLALWCLDFPKVRRVAGWTDQLTGSDLDAVETQASALVVLDPHVSLQLATSWRMPLGVDAEISIRFIGEHGSAVFRNVNGSFHQFTAERMLRDAAPKTLAEPPDDWGGRAATGWARALAVSNRFDASIESLKDVSAILDAIYDSARTQ
jgi:predicted dehydrogenase